MVPPSFVLRLVLAAVLFGSAASTFAQAHPLVASLSFERFKQNMEDLAEFGNRVIDSPGNQQAEIWLENELQALGYNVETMTFDFGGPFKNVWATKIGSVNPDKMYIVSAHFDGVGGHAVDDDASGTSLVLEIARVLAPETIQVDTSIRFIFWNVEEFGVTGSRRYVEQRAALQGVEEPAGSGLFPEPTWLGMIQHDMILYDHGLPPQPNQIPEADLDIEYQASSDFAAESLALAQTVLGANIEHATDYPAEIGDDMDGTDSVRFMDHTAAISIRENPRSDISDGSNPHHHQVTDVMASYSEDDFRLGFNAIQTTLGALIELAGVDATRLFEDGFEGGNTSAWSAAVGAP